MPATNRHSWYGWRPDAPAPRDRLHAEIARGEPGLERQLQRHASRRN